MEEGGRKPGCLFTNWLLQKSQSPSPCPRMVGGSLHKQGNLPTRLVLVAKISSPPLLARILKAFTESFSGFRHACCPESLSNTLFLQGCLLKNGSQPGNPGQIEHFKDTGGVNVPPISQAQLADQSSVTSLFSLSSLDETEQDPRGSSWESPPSPAPFHILGLLLVCRQMLAS